MIVWENSGRKWRLGLTQRTRSSTRSKKLSKPSKTLSGIPTDLINHPIDLYLQFIVYNYESNKLKI